MKVDVAHRDGQTRIHPVGVLDAAGARTLKQQVDALEFDPDAVVSVDLADVPFLDSSGLGVLIALVKKARRAGGDLQLANLGEQPRRLIQLTQLGRFFGVDPTAA